MSKPVVGISENKFTRGQENLFKICGAGLKPASGKPDPVVDLDSTTHDWGPVTMIGINPKWLCVSSTPTRKHTTRRAAAASDDITVTITFDSGLGSAFDVTITCDDVDYVDPTP